MGRKRCENTNQSHPGIVAPGLGAQGSGGWHVEFFTSSF